MLACLYLGVTGVLSLPDNILLAIHGTIGMLFIPLFSFFLSVRFLFSIRQVIAARTRDVAIVESRVIRINLSTRPVATLLRP